MHIVFSKDIRNWIYIQNRNRLTDIENKHAYQKGERGRRDKLEV